MCETKIDPSVLSFTACVIRMTALLHISDFFSKNVLEYTNVITILHFLHIFLFIQQFFFIYTVSFFR